MNKLLTATTLATLMALGAGTAMAQDATATDKAARREAVKNMTPEQKAEKKAEMKAKWDAMTPEQQAQYKKDHPKLAAKMAEKKAAQP